VNDEPCQTAHNDERSGGNAQKSREDKNNEKNTNRRQVDQRRFGQFDDSIDNEYTHRLECH
jgi:hypothetical protein